MPRSPLVRSLTGFFSLLALGVPLSCGDSATPTPASAGSGGHAQAGSGGGGITASGGSSNNAGASSGAAGAKPNGGAGGAGGASGAAGTTGAGGTPSGGSAGNAGSAGSTNNAGSGGGGGGGAGSAGSGGTGGGATYNPCPSGGEPCRIMPLGDSITDGVGSSHAAGYRVELFRLSLMNQKKLTFVGSHESGPNNVENTPFPKQQEGHSGWTIDDGGGRSGLYPKIQGWLTATPPHIITLMIGTNDIDIQLDVAKAPERLELLLDRIIAAAPNALIVLAQMVPTTDNTENQRVQAYNAAMPALVKARADAGKHIILVDMYGAFTKNTSYASAYMNDKLHPKDAGYVVMANTWWEAIGPLLK